MSTRTPCDTLGTIPPLPLARLARPVQNRLELLDTMPDLQLHGFTSDSSHTG
jgi:hypothetical protein